MEASGHLYLAAALPLKNGPAVPTEYELHGAQCLNGYFGHVKQSGNHTYKRNIEARSSRPSIVAVQKQKVLLIVSRLSIQHAKRMSHIVWPSVACLALLDFSTHSPMTRISGNRYFEFMTSVRKKLGAYI